MGIETVIHLDKLMKSRGRMNIQELHELTGISRTVISNILKGNTNVTVLTLERLCKALNCSMDELITFE